MAGRSESNSCNGGGYEYQRHGFERSPVSFRQHEDGNNVKRLNLWDRASHEITISHTNAACGEQNPYKDPQVETVFWLILNIEGIFGKGLEDVTWAIFPIEGIAIFIALLTLKYSIDPVDIGRSELD